MFSMLPIEVLNNVFSFLSPKEIASLEITSKFFGTKLTNSSCWKNFILKRLSEKQASQQVLISYDRVEVEKIINVISEHTANFKSAFISVHQLQRILPNKKLSSALILGFMGEISALARLSLEINDFLVGLTLAGNIEALHKVAIDYKIDLKSIKDERRQNLLFYGVLLNDEKFLQELLNIGIDPFEKNHSGNNLLHIAAMVGKERIVTSLLKLGLNPYEIDKMGFTPLQYSASHGYLEIVKIFVSEGFADDPEKSSYTALQLAHNHPEIANFLSTLRRKNHV